MIMGHMKWVSTLDRNDLARMKHLVNKAKEGDEHLFFQDRRHEISYIKAVILLLENKYLSEEMKLRFSN